MFDLSCYKSPEFIEGNSLPTDIQVIYKGFRVVCRGSEEEPEYQEAQLIVIQDSNGNVLKEIYEFTTDLSNTKKDRFRRMALGLEEVPTYND